jgi:hypothetical protein
MYFSRAVLLAIYADHPAARKCAMTGSACPQCYTVEEDMAEPPHGGFMEMRTDMNMRDRKRALVDDLLAPDADDREESKKRGRKEGVMLTFRNAWEEETDNWVFGPHPDYDCIYQCLPQPTLHGMDEGLISKLCRGLVAMAIACSNHSAAAVSAAEKYLVEVHLRQTSQKYISEVHFRCIFVLVYCTYLVHPNITTGLPSD